MRRRQLWGLVAVVGVAVAAYLAIGSAWLRKPRPNVIFILCDTLRADRLGAYGNQQGLTPFLDSLAAKSIVYDRAYSASSWTVPSIASLFVAQFPSEHQVVLFDSVLPEYERTFAEVLRQSGYSTGGFSANFQISKANGFGQGFEKFPLLFAEPKYDATRVNKLALQWLASVTSPRRPFFLYLQYMEVHSPYRMHAGITRSADGNVGMPDSELNERVLAGARDLTSTSGIPDAWKFTPPQTHRLWQLYDGEVKYLDGTLRDLFVKLKRHHWLDNTMVIVIADHGEEFGDHGLYEHGKSLYQPEIHVPLIIHLPGERHGRHVTAPVETAGLAPALLSWLNITPPETFHVPALPLRHLAVASGAATYAYSELLAANPAAYVAQRQALVARGEKLCVLPDGKRVFYDLSHDPGELHPVANPPFASRLLAAMRRVTSTLLAEGNKPAQKHAIDAATRERLRALGYGAE